MGGAPYPDQEDSLGLSRGGRRIGRAHWAYRSADMETWGQEQGLRIVHRLGVMRSDPEREAGTVATHIVQFRVFPEITKKPLRFEAGGWDMD